MRLRQFLISLCVAITIAIPAQAQQKSEFLANLIGDYRLWCPVAKGGPILLSHYDHVLQKGIYVCTTVFAKDGYHFVFRATTKDWIVGAPEVPDDKCFLTVAGVKKGKGPIDAYVFASACDGSALTRPIPEVLIESKIDRVSSFSIMEESLEAVLKAMRRTTKRDE